MTSKKQNMIIITGPTASGKSDLAIRIARKFGGEIISADSRQVYRGMNIGTAKVRGVMKNDAFISGGIPHYCIDIASPKKIVTATDFKQYAQFAVKKIISHHKIPILAGGTGFWVDTVAYDKEYSLVPPNQSLRKKLEKKTPSKLFALLKKLDPHRANTIEQKNPRRLVRAIEIAKALGHVPNIKRSSPYRTLWIGLSPSPKVLKRRIITRTRAMIRQGLIAETKRLLHSGVSEKRIREFGFEYLSALRFIKKEINRSELLEILIRATMQYAKRQQRWFKRNKDIQWISKLQEVQQIVKKFLTPAATLTSQAHRPMNKEQTKA